jgi:DNA-binding transcriptional MocR family regulator
MHLIGWLPTGIKDTVISARAAEAGLDAMPVSHFRLPTGAVLDDPAGLLLGFAGFSSTTLSAAVERLAAIVKSALTNN